MRERRRFLKQKPILYCDEHFPADVVAFLREMWRSKVKVLTAIDEGTRGRSDRFHCQYYQKHRYTLVTLDLDFNDDRLYPFTHGKMPGMIIIRADSGEARKVYDYLARLLECILRVPLPKAFLTETKCVCSRDGVVMRGRDTKTLQIKTLHVRAGETPLRQMLQFFSY